MINGDLSLRIPLDNLTGFFYSVSFVFSSGIIWILGSLSTSLLAIFLSNDNSNDGSSNKLANIANRSVVDTNAPNATVPPKLEIVKTEKPKKSTIEV